jgi:exodeoxyribonuclease-3
MKLVSWNVNGIRSIHKKGMFVSTVERLKPDILCLQETKAEEHQSEVDLPEYEEYWNSSSGRKGYAGTAIFTKAKPLGVLLGFPEDILKKFHLADLPAPRPGQYFVYVLLCADESFYIGQTQDLQKRWAEHRKGSGVEHTRKHQPARIAHFETFGSREEATKREHDLKTGFGRKWLKGEWKAGRTRQAGGYGDPNREGRLIAAEFDDLYVVNVYTPNAKPDLSRLTLRHKHWDPAFLSYMRELEKKKPVAFCGDLNVAHTEDDLANPKQNEGEHGFTKEEREGIDRIVEAGFVDTFRLFTKGRGHYSWWSNFSRARDRNIGWRIDYWFVSHSLAKKVKKALIHADIYGSDHCPVSLELDI